MGKTTIEWTATIDENGVRHQGYSFNPWEGCQKVGPGCDHCYAEARDVRFTGGTHWGPGAPRRLTGRANWNKPLRWDSDAAKAGTRPRVFCASLADVFDNAVDRKWRADLFDLIRITPNLDWLLLTKRPGNIAKMLPAGWGDGYPNVWLGCTVVNQEEADRDIPKLLSVPAAVRFLSMEPLLGPVDIAWALGHPFGIAAGFLQRGHFSPGAEKLRGLNWVIVGGESGPHARPMHPDWARSLRDQCVAAGVPFLFKQWGEWAADDHFTHFPDPVTSRGMHEWFEADNSTVESHSWRYGKKAAGRTLDGVEWSQFPDSPTSAREASK